MGRARSDGGRHPGRRRKPPSRDRSQGQAPETPPSSPGVSGGSMPDHRTPRAGSMDAPDEPGHDGAVPSSILHAIPALRFAPTGMT
ncbi:MAG: hypothetical protein DI565_04480 [Ancylobacter novellus]|uniref:Uncharacterized protein n=1 Tax=Ancylobacter novellus TaxID=921 RepID=A0A2W5KM05_ANCNO|nr:MAG: hypothetical protein DI565_04480 [Ancylobacter novellus]